MVAFASDEPKLGVLSFQDVHTTTLYIYGSISGKLCHSRAAATFLPAPPFKILTVTRLRAYMHIVYVAPRRITAN